MMKEGRKEGSLVMKERGKEERRKARRGGGMRRKEGRTEGTLIFREASRVL
jgi:hypothetical protein